MELLVAKSREAAAISHDAFKHSLASIEKTKAVIARSLVLANEAQRDLERARRMKSAVIAG